MSTSRASDDLDHLLALLRAGFQGDPYEGGEAFTDDAVFRDNVGEAELVGRDEIVQHLAAFGGRREVFEVVEVVRDGDRAAVRYGLHFRADAHAYSQHGMAFVTVTDGRLSRWRGTWVETETDLRHWAND